MRQGAPFSENAMPCHEHKKTHESDKGATTSTVAQQLCRLWNDGNVHAWLHACKRIQGIYPPGPSNLEYSTGGNAGTCRVPERSYIHIHTSLSPSIELSTRTG